MEAVVVEVAVVEVVVVEVVVVDVVVEGRGAGGEQTLSCFRSSCVLDTGNLIFDFSACRRKRSFSRRSRSISAWKLCSRSAERETRRSISVQCVFCLESLNI